MMSEAFICCWMKTVTISGGFCSGFSGRATVLSSDLLLVVAALAGLAFPSFGLLFVGPTFFLFTGAAEDVVAGFFVAVAGVVENGLPAVFDVVGDDGSVVLDGAPLPIGCLLGFATLAVMGPSGLESLF